MSEPTDTPVDHDPTPDGPDSRFLQEAGFHADYADLLVCPACGDLYRREGISIGSHAQKCRCRRFPEDEVWEGFDYNEYARLCLCCGRAVLKSGSRWSAWFCDECKEPIRGMNLSHGWRGVPVIPQGRHSLMNQLSLSAEERKNARAVARFTEEFKGLAHGMAHLFTYGRERVMENLTLTGHKRSPVSLRQCLIVTGKAALVNPRLSRETALLGLMAHFGIEATPADLPRFRARVKEWKRRLDKEG